MKPSSGLIDRLSATPYRQRILDGMATALAPFGRIPSALDFGAGDGFFARHLPDKTPIDCITPLDVVQRESSWVVPTLYDGRRVPFEDRAFDLVYAVDVVHHCPDPMSALAEMARCSARLLLLKDHNHQGPIGKWALGVMDELGNRRFGIASPGLYQKNWAWVEWMEANGFVRRTWQHPMACHVGPMALTNGLQFLALWERRSG